MADAAKWRFVAFLIVALVVNVNRVRASEEVIKKMSKTFFNLMEECKKELSIDKNMVASVVKFWMENSDHSERELGCLISCMAHKQDLLHLDKSRLNHQNAHEFAKDHGADDETAKQLVTIIHECEELHTEKEDHCWRSLEVARCFRDHMHKLKWAPSVDVMVTEILAQFA